MYDIVALGECLIDFTPAGTNESGMLMFSRNPGGAPANVLAMCVKLGSTASFIGKVGDDDFGTFLEQTMMQVGIDCTGLRRDCDIPTTLAFVHLDESGERSFTFYRNPGADIMLHREDIPAALLEQCRIFHFGSVSLTDEPARSATLWAVTRAKRAGALISFDPNYRPFLWTSPESAKELIISVLPLADILKVSEEELILLTGTADIAAGAAALSMMGPQVVFVTMGAQGAYFHTHAGEGSVPAYDVKTIDTTGAGDAFWGCLLNSILTQNAQSLEAISHREWLHAATRACAAGSLTTTVKGAISSMPDNFQIKQCMQNTAVIKN